MSRGTACSLPHHAPHHRGHPIAHESTYLLRMVADSVRHSWVALCLCYNDAIGGKHQLSSVAAGIAEQGWQARAHAGDLGMLVEVLIHARNMSLELSDQVWKVGFGRCANATVDRLDRSSYLAVAVEEVHIAAHVGLGRAAHHSGPHHPAVADGLQGVPQQVPPG